MSDNIFILGAGFSHAAGIPLLGGIIERMWECAVRATYNGNALSAEDHSVFSKAIDVMRELDGYHGRSGFDDRNIEDVLSLLAFGALGGGQSERKKLTLVTKALARVIEVSCSVKHPGVSRSMSVVTDGPELYRRFWRSIFAWISSGKKPPTIITLNYDLVLERSLMQVLNSDKHYNRHNSPVPFQSLSVRYHARKTPDYFFGVEYTQYNGPNFTHTDGVVLRPKEARSPSSVDFNILKLHGSLNFKEASGGDNEGLCKSQSAPNILPPIFNKLSAERSAPAWGVALEQIRQAKNIVIVGYSLPRTDIYMQYFLKAALGPNKDLNRLTVFDPVLFQDSDGTRDMEKRYRECFSPQLQRRIILRPAPTSSLDSKDEGTTNHFVRVLEKVPANILF